MGFMSDALFDGRPYPASDRGELLFSRGPRNGSESQLQGVQCGPDPRSSGDGRGRPKTARVDNGPEFAGHLLDKWAYLNGVELDLSRPGTPTDNAFIEAFNARIEQSVPMPPGSSSWRMRGDRGLADQLQHQAAPLGPGHLTPEAFARQAETARKVS
jgi:putative transposase